MSTPDVDPVRAFSNALTAAARGHLQLNFTTIPVIRQAATHIDDRIDRRVKTGAKDRGDIGGVRTHGQRVVLECKDTARINLAGWATETELERGNDDALAGVIVHKRHGVADPAQQWVTCTLQDFAALLTGQRPIHNTAEDPAIQQRPVVELRARSGGTNR